MDPRAGSRRHRARRRDRGALVRALVAAGAETVVATDLRADAIAGGDRVVAKALDVGDEAATIALVERGRGRPRADRPVVRQRRCRRRRRRRRPRRVWALQWQVNVMAHVYAARALLPGGSPAARATSSRRRRWPASSRRSATASTRPPSTPPSGSPSGWRSPTPSRACKVVVHLPRRRRHGDAAASTAGDAAKASAIIGGGDVLVAGRGGGRVVAAVTDDVFLIYTHPELKRLRRAQGRRPRPLDPRHGPPLGSLAAAAGGLSAPCRPATASWRRPPAASASAASTPSRSTRSPPRSASRKQTVLYWFPSKEELVDAVLRGDRRRARRRHRGRRAGGARRAAGPRSTPSCRPCSASPCAGRRCSAWSAS